MNARWILIAVIVLVLGAAGAWAFGISTSSSSSSDSSVIVETNDNGSGTHTDTDTTPNPPPGRERLAPWGGSVTLAVGQSVTLPDGLVVKLLEINDSRCKPDVQCIWAGELSGLFLATRGSSADPDDNDIEFHLWATTNKTLNFDSTHTASLESATRELVTIHIDLISTSTGTIPRACTMEAKQCPDGSYVGRTGPNCEFSVCP